MAKSHLVRQEEWPIRSIAEACRVPILEGAEKALSGWLDRLVEWNQKLDLTAARSNDELLDLMLADALILSANIEKGARVVDIGSGAGAPGLPLALLRPDLSLTLVEPLVKRVSFMRTVIGALGAPNVQIVHGRGETLQSTFDVAISRATLSAASWLALGATLAPSVWVLLAKEAEPDAPGAALETCVEYTWPRTAVHRRAAKYAIQKS